jgi:hypothetical protein
MTDGFTVDPAVLDDHAFRLRDFVDALREASTKGEALNIDAYGVVGRNYAGTVVEASKEIDKVIDDLCTAGGAIPHVVGAVADDYQATDETVADSFGRP